MLDPSYSGNTKFVCVRYGNVLGSRGSVVPYFCDLIQKELPLQITNPAMTRFQLTLDESVQLVLWATVEGKPGDLWVRKMPAANIVDLATALCIGLTGRRDYPMHVVGTRPGEKLHEVLVSEDEMWRARDLGDYFHIPGWVAPPDAHGPKQESSQEYSSDRTHQMGVDEILEMLRVDGWVSRERAGLGAKASASKYS